MAISKKLRLINTIKDRLATIKQTNGYRSNIGNNIVVYSPVGSFDYGIFIFIADTVITSKYGKHEFDTLVRVEAILPFNNINALGLDLVDVENRETSEILDDLYVDLYECLSGVKQVCTFTNGISLVKSGDIFLDSALKQGYVESVTVTSGSFATSDAAGNIVIRRMESQVSNGTIAVSGVPSCDITFISFDRLNFEDTNINMVKCGFDSEFNTEDYAIGIYADLRVVYTVPIGIPF